jgi:hypothetical protein
MPRIKGDQWNRLTPQERRIVFRYINRYLKNNQSSDPIKFYQVALFYCSLLFFFIPENPLKFILIIGGGTSLAFETRAIVLPIIKILISGGGGG